MRDKWSGVKERKWQNDPRGIFERRKRIRMTLEMWYKCKPTVDVKIAQIFSGNGATMRSFFSLSGTKRDLSYLRYV